MKSLNAKHMKAIQALHQGKSKGEAAKAAGVCRTSLVKWLEKPVFAEELKRLEEAERVAVEGELGEAVDFQAQVRERTRKFYFSIMERIEPSIDSLDEMGLSRTLPPLVKAVRDATEMALSTDNETLGLEALAREVDALSKTQK
jgi:hypothetical protein